ncbi:hypothetical protein [Pseudomonas soli]|uniref:hypothetical protein n=1 Tax=Pseudomonas soli TaxID=1306993 RepID=UPI0039E19401
MAPHASVAGRNTYRRIIGVHGLVSGASGTTGQVLRAATPTDKITGAEHGERCRWHHLAVLRAATPTDRITGADGLVERCQ